MNPLDRPAPHSARAALALLAACASLFLGACAGSRPDNTPRLDTRLFRTLVFQDKGVETGRLTDTAAAAFITRLNGARADSGGAVKSSCRVFLVGTEGTQRMRTQGDRFSLSGAGCRFGQAHCRYRADFDVEAACRVGGKKEGGKK